jgi:uncharacterized protein YqjF (DUF2071 family)
MNVSPPTAAQRLAQRHRPDDRPVMRQLWRNLLFVHWSVDPEVIRGTLPEGLHVDTYGGRAWLGIVPFFMRGVRWMWTPPIPGTSSFQELNVRTYVYDSEGTPGVWFYSLDANCWPAVKGARWTFHLPYYWCRMSYSKDPTSGRIQYWSHRRGTRTDLESQFDYEPAGAVGTAQDPESFEFFLVERYVLFAERQGRLYSGRVHHPPYPATGATLRQWDDHPLVLDGFDSPGRAPDHVLMSRGVDVDIFALRRLGGR